MGSRRQRVTELLLGHESEPPPPTVATLVAGVNVVSSAICIATAVMHRGLPREQRKAGIVVGSATGLGWMMLLRRRRAFARIVERHPIRSAAVNSVIAGSSSWLAGGYKNPLYLQAWTQTAASTITVAPRGGYVWGAVAAVINGVGIKRTVTLREVRWNRDLIGLIVSLKSLVIAGRIGALVGDVEHRERPLRAAVLDELPLVELRRELLDEFGRCYDDLCEFALRELPQAPVADETERRLALQAAAQFAAGRDELAGLHRANTADATSLTDAAIRWGTARLRGRALELSVRVAPNVPDPLDEDVARTLRNVVQQSFQNVAEHADHATRVTLELRIDDGNLVAAVVDDGGNESTPGEPGSGFFHCRLEAARLGGDFEIRQANNGVVQELRIPLARAAVDPETTKPALGHEPELRVSVAVERQLEGAVQSVQSAALLDAAMRVLAGETIERWQRKRAIALLALLALTHRAPRTTAGSVARTASGALLTAGVPSYVPLCPLWLVGTAAEVTHRRGGDAGAGAAAIFGAAVASSAARSSFSALHRWLNFDIPFAVALSTTLGVAFGWLSRALTSRAVRDETRLGDTQVALDQLETALEHARYWHHTVAAFRFDLLPSVQSPVRRRLHEHLTRLDELHNQLDAVSDYPQSLEAMIRREVALRVPGRVHVEIDEPLLHWLQTYPAALRAAAASDRYALAKLAGAEAAALAREAPVDLLGQRRMNRVDVKLRLDGSLVSIELAPRAPASRAEGAGPIARVVSRLLHVAAPQARRAEYRLRAPLL